MTRIRRMLLLPALALLAFFVARVLAPVDADAAINRVFNVTAFLLAAAGCFSVARAFQAGDYLRVAWQLQAAASLVLAASRVLSGLEPQETMNLARTPLVFMANVMTVLSAAIFARAHRVAGLSLPWSRRARVIFGAAVALLAFAAAGPAIAVQLPRALAGQMLSWMQIFSSIGDFVFLVLIAPICMTAVALRGGLLTWPWALLTASTVAWLVYDAQDTLIYLFPHLEDVDLTLITVPLRVAACTFLFLASRAQQRLTSGAVDRSGA